MASGSFSDNQSVYLEPTLRNILDLKTLKWVN